MLRLLNASSIFLLVISVSSCSWGDGAASSPDGSGSSGLDYKDSFSAVGWEWRAPKGAEVVDVAPVSEGVAVFFDDRVLVVSGDRGEEIWSYKGAEEAGSVTSNGDYVSVRVEDELLLLDPVNGDIAHEITSSVVGRHRVRIDRKSVV